MACGRTGLRLALPLSVFSRRSSLIGIAAAAMAGGFVLGLTGYVQPQRPVEFCALIFAGVMVSAFAQAAAEDRAAMAPSFVVELATLLIFGVHAATLVAVAGVLGRAFADSQRTPDYRRTLLNVITAAAATQGAGFV